MQKILKDCFDFTGFLRACKRGHSDIVKILMENASIVSAIDKNVVTDFYLACERGCSDVVNIFLQNFK